MMRKEKGVAENQELVLGLKLKRGLKKCGPCTPEPTWKMGSKDHHYYPKPSARTVSVSARKLGANLWEIQDLPSSANMNKNATVFRARQNNKDKGLELPPHLADPSHSPPDEPTSASSLGRHVAASLIQHHKLIERSGRAIQPLSPASCSSMEVATYNQAITPTSSLDFKGKSREASYSLKTSTELLKVLNRIWSLEEQHSANISLVKALKLELDHARVRIQELMQEQEADRHEIDDLMKQVAEDKLIRKSKEQDKIKAAVQSVRDELEDERKLRRRSESLHRKLARELSEVKYAFAKAMKELEKEKKARNLLEDLCDEFARGIGDYEQEVRSLKSKSRKDMDERDDRLILHISEAWLDERVQVKLAEAHHDLTEKQSIVDRLKCEIETFLQAKRSAIQYQEEPTKDARLRRQSIESVLFNEALSAPQDAGDEDSVASDLHCFELNKKADDIDRENDDQSKPVVYRAIEEKSKSAKKKAGSRERIKGQQMDGAKSQNANITPNIDKVQGNQKDTMAEAGEDKSNQIEITVSQKSENCEAIESAHDRKGRRDVAQLSNHSIGNLIRSRSPFSESIKVQSGTDQRENSCGPSSWRDRSFKSYKDNNGMADSLGLASPIQKWSYQQTSPDLDISEGSSKWPRGLKENTLKAKLLEARLEGQHARLKTSKGS